MRGQLWFSGRRWYVVVVVRWQVSCAVGVVAAVFWWEVGVLCSVTWFVVLVLVVSPPSP